MSAEDGLCDVCAEDTRGVLGEHHHLDWCTPQWRQRVFDSLPEGTSPPLNPRFVKGDVVIFHHSGMASNIGVINGVSSVSVGVVWDGRADRVDSIVNPEKELVVIGVQCDTCEGKGSRKTGWWRPGSSCPAVDTEVATETCAWCVGRPGAILWTGKKRGIKGAKIDVIHVDEPPDSQFYPPPPKPVTTTKSRFAQDDDDWQQRVKGKN